MSDKDINIHIKADGTEDVKSQLGDVGKSAQQLGQKTAEGTGQATNKMSLFASQIGRLKSYFLGMFGAVEAIHAVTTAIKLQIEAMKEHADIALKMQNRLLRLQFLGDFYKEKPELKKEVMALAEFGRRPFEEVADAYYNLRSKGAGLSGQQQSELMREALEYGQTDPNAPLDTLVDMFALYAKQTKEKNANRVQNVIRETITQAGGSTADVAQYMPKFLPIGISGGLTGEETAGIWAYTTTQLASSEQATTGLQNVFMSLQGKGTPESQKLLKRLGIKTDMSFFEKLSQLSQKQAEGKLGIKQAEEISKKEGAAALLLLIRDIPAMMKTVNTVVAAGASERDLTREAIEDLFDKDEMARLEDQSRQKSVRIANLKAMDIKAVRIENIKKQNEIAMREQGLDEVSIAVNKAIDTVVGGFGFMPPRILEPNETNQPSEPNQTNIHYDYSVHNNPTVGALDYGGYNPNVQ